ncbi:MAG TPA: hypothetical protein VGC09_00505 [Rhodopila sp.]
MSTTLSSIVSTAWELGFEGSPILFSGGIAQNIPGQLLPIIAITESISLVGGLLNGSLPSMDNLFAKYRPLPGSNLAKFDLGRYAYAGQAIAANAIISQPLRVSMLMMCPANQAGGLVTKLAVMMALKAVISQHASLGGLYVVATPAIIYDNLALLEVTDVTPGDSKQAQAAYQWDFEQLLITGQAAGTVLNTMLSKVAGGVPTDGSLSGAAAVGSAQSGAGALPGLVGSSIQTSDAVQPWVSAAPVPVQSSPL